VLAILTLGVVPLMQVSLKRQKEQQLREVLRQMRERSINSTVKRWPAHSCKPITTQEGSPLDSHHSKIRRSSRENIFNDRACG